MLRPNKPLARLAAFSLLAPLAIGVTPTRARGPLAAPQSAAQQQNVTVTVGAPIKRSELPFGTVEAYDLRIVYKENIGDMVKRIKASRGEFFFVQPPSDNGWSQKVRSIRVVADGKELQADGQLDWLKRPVYHTTVTKDSGEFGAVIETTIANRVITENMKNPNPTVLSPEDRLKYTRRDYTFARGIESGVNKPRLKAEGLLKRDDETTWRFVARAMTDGRKRWNYGGKATFPKTPTDWFNQVNTGNCDDMASYLSWLLRESDIPSRVSVNVRVSKERGRFDGHAFVEFFSVEHGCWIPADLTAFNSRGGSASDLIGRDSTTPTSGIRFISSDDVSYWVQSTPGTEGGVAIKYGGVPYFADTKRYARFRAIPPSFEVVAKRPIED